MSAQMMSIFSNSTTSGLSGAEQGCSALAHDGPNTVNSTAPTLEEQNIFDAVLNPQSNLTAKQTEYTSNGLMRETIYEGGCVGHDNDAGQGKAEAGQVPSPMATVDELMAFVQSLLAKLQGGGTPGAGDGTPSVPISGAPTPSMPIPSFPSMPNIPTPIGFGPGSTPPAATPPSPNPPPPVSNPAPNNGESILVNTVVGGSGDAQRDLDPTKSGTQINVVLAKGMSNTDKQSSLEALRRWENASNGELDFTVYEQGDQPGGKDFILMKAVPPDNTTQAGIADVGRSPDGVTELEFESGSSGARLAVIMHEIGHTLGLRHTDEGVLKAVNATENFSNDTLADLASLYPGINNNVA